MRPIALRFQAFGPYVGRQEIDFTKLAKAGLFLISGETGSGKTTILDAMTYALYGKSSGALRGDIATMRCQQAPEDLDTEIQFDFAIGSCRYRFIRRIEIRKSGPKASHAAGVLDEEGIFRPFGEKLTLKGIEAKAEELLGLKYDQFRQVIVLPQGQFERLLVSESKEKEEILVTLFAADKWQKIADSIFEKVYARKRDLDEEQIRIQASLAVHDCESLEQLEERIRATAMNLKEKKQEKQLLDLEEGKARAHFDGEKLSAERFLQLDRNLVRRSELEKGRSDRDALEVRLQKAVRAEGVKPLFDSFTAAQMRLEERRKGMVRAVREKEQAELLLEQARIRQAEADAGAEADREHQLRLAAYGNMEESYRELEESGRQLKAAGKVLKSARKAVEELQEKVQKAERHREGLLCKEQELTEGQARLLKNYLRNISGTLAGKLEEGRPCPVCGSVEHPAPAELQAADVTEEQLNAGQQLLDGARKQSRQAAADLESAVKEEQAARSLAEEARLEEQLRKSSHGNLLGMLDPDIPDIDALLKARKMLEQKVSSYEESLKAAREARGQADRSLAGAYKAEELARGELEMAEGDQVRLESDLQVRLEAEGFLDLSELQECLMDPLEKAAGEQSLKDFAVETESVASLIADLEQDLRGKERPDVPALEAGLKALAAEVRNLADALAVEEKLLMTLSESHTALERSLEAYKLQAGRLEEDLLFARLLRGDRGLSLQRYVLGVMLTSITSEANKLLAEVHDGRYRLRRKPELAGNKKAGLEFEVHDGHSGQYRGVASLSGGEKFLVALSLSIGLSSVVQAQSGGIRLDAMFVDEGFGSLDPGSIREAIGILSHIRGMNNGLVGIISHVDSLKESISAKIEVSKSRSGNSLRVSY